MKLCMFSPKGMNLDRGWPGRVDGECVVQLAAQTLQAFFTGGGGAREHASFRLGDIELRPPVLHPPSVRIFSLAGSGEPYFHFGNTASIYGPGDEIRAPAGTNELDYGLALAAVIGADGAVGGFTLANDWAARDLERAEARRGRSKSHDFAMSLGPVVVTPEELHGSALLVARVNGDERSHVDLGGVRWDELVAYAARDTTLRPGDLLLAAPPPEPRAPLLPGDVVELELEPIGVLRNRITAGV